MRWILVVTLLASLCQGCFVFDELQKGEEIMAQHSPKAREKPEAQEEASAARGSPGTGAKQQEGMLERLQLWWQKKREPAPPERDPADVVVRCQIGGSMQFTRKSDCTLRGGRAI